MTPLAPAVLKAMKGGVTMAWFHSRCKSYLEEYTPEELPL
jgi:hypothetical protein